MVDACRITGSPLRTGVDGSGVDVTTPGSVRYEGKCRLQEVSVPGGTGPQGAVAERPAWLVQQQVLQLPIAVTNVLVGDEVEMTASALDQRVVGRRLRVVSFTAKTHLTARRLQCEEIGSLPFASDRVAVLRAATFGDAYGNTLKDWTSTTSTPVVGLVEALPSDESPLSGGRTQVTNRFRVWLPAGTPVAAGDRLSWLGRTLEVDGDPEVFADAVAGLPLRVQASEIRG